jgi:PAS domain S-box-containing protein
MDERFPVREQRPMDPISTATPLDAAALCAFQEAREAFFLFRPSDDRILEANPAAKRLTGLTADQLRSRGLSDLFVDPAAEAADARGAAAATYLFSMHITGQGRFPVRLAIRPVPAADEPLALAIVERISAATPEPTRPGGAAAQPDENRDRFRQLADRIDLVLWFTALDPVRVLYVNPAFERVWGVSAEKLYRDPLLWQRAIHPDDREQVRHAHAEWLTGKRSRYEVEYRIIRPDGAERCIADQAVLLRDERGVVDQICGIAKDITAHRDAEAAYLRVKDQLLEQQRREKERVQAELAKVREELIRQTRLATLGRMSASVAHDLRNPLGAVRNAAYYLSRKVPPTEPKWAEYLAIIDREVVACDQIISNMLELTRAKEPVPQPLDLGELVRRAFERAKPPADVHCHFQAPAEPFLVRADPVQLRQVFDNLTKNSLDALAGRGDVWVVAAPAEGGWTVTFSDTGPGIPTTVRNRLFEPLFTTKAKGTGLGLWICRQVVERHGGTLDVVEIPGRGLALRITLPR